MKNFKKIVLGLMVGAMAISFSAFTTKSAKLAPGDYRFYNRDGIANQGTSNYVFHTSTTLCDAASTVCSEVWNIGNQTPPIDGKELSSYTTAPTYVGSSAPGDYTGN